LVWPCIWLKMLVVLLLVFLFDISASIIMVRWLYNQIMDSHR
jgi:hypothetical protein